MVPNVMWEVWTRDFGDSKARLEPSPKEHATWNIHHIANWGSGLPQKQCFISYKNTHPSRQDMQQCARPLQSDARNTLHNPQNHCNHVTWQDTPFITHCCCLQQCANRTRSKKQPVAEDSNPDSDSKTTATNHHQHRHEIHLLQHPRKPPENHHKNAKTTAHETAVTCHGPPWDTTKNN